MRISDIKSITATLSLCALLTLIPSAHKVMAAEAPSGGDDSASDMSGMIYYTLGPSFVSNYDGAGRLKYLKTDIAVRIDPGTASMLDNHLPYIRNKLVVLFAAQLEENLTSTQGKEILRNQALNEVKAALDFLQGGEAGSRVKNLYFTSFVVQR